MMNLDLQVVANPEDGSLRVIGSARMRAQEGGTRGPNLALRRGEMRFDSVRPPEGARADVDPSGAAASVRFPNPVPAGTEIVIETQCAKLPRAGRRVGLNRDGAFASWAGGGVWYPIPAAGPGPYRNGDAPGRTSLTVPERWRTLSSGHKVSSTVANGVRTDTWETKDDLGRAFIATAFQVRPGRKVATYFAVDDPVKAAAYTDWGEQVIQTLSARFGPFPFTDYAIAAIPASLAPPGFVGRAEPGYFLGHENTLAASRPNLPLIAHEMSHSWWAIQVRCGGEPTARRGDGPIRGCPRYGGTLRPGGRPPASGPE